MTSLWVRDMCMVFNVSFNNISTRRSSDLLFVEDTGEPRENQRPTANHWQTLPNNVVLSTSRLRVICTDCICSYKSNCNTITTMTNPTSFWSDKIIPFFNKTKIIQMTTSMSRELKGLIDWCLTPPSAVFQLYHGVPRLPIACINFNNAEFSMITLLSQLYVRVCTLFRCGKPLHDRIILPREKGLGPYN